jgi:hypothetical protein
MDFRSSDSTSIRFADQIDRESCGARKLTIEALLVSFKFNFKMGASVEATTKRGSTASTRVMGSRKSKIAQGEWLGQSNSGMRQEED